MKAEAARRISLANEGLIDSCDLLIANILANPLIELAPMLAESVRPGGQLALSGILRDQWSAVASAYRTDFDMQAPVFLEDWSRLSGTRKV